MNIIYKESFDYEEFIFQLNNFSCLQLNIRSLSLKTSGRLVHHYSTIW